MRINGHKLPTLLEDLIERGEWARFTKSPRLVDIFVKSDICDPNFYDETALQLENEGWPNEDSPAYLGIESSESPPGDIDPRQSVIVADLGPDRPIALDYRSGGEPRVVYLANNWIEAAPNIEVLVQMLSSSALDIE